MKLCRVVLAVSLFLSGGIGSAVAGEPADEDSRREITYAGSTSAAKARSLSAQYFYGPAGEKTLTIILPRYKSIVETQNWDFFYAAGKINDDARALAGEDEDLDPDVQPPPSAGVDDELAEGGMGMARSETYRSDDGFSVYDFTVPFDGAVTMVKADPAEEIDNGFFPVSPENAFAATDDHLSSDKGTYTTFVFDKTTFTSGPNNPQIMSGGSYLDDLMKEEDFSSPYMVPFSLLLFMLGFWFLLVMFTSFEIKMKE